MPEPDIQEQASLIYIGGAVTNSGFYPLMGRDSIEALIQAAGGTTDGADLSQLKLHISGAGDEEQPQKIDLNHAQAWLLEALPGIGEVRAQDIINYREQNGLFRNINELLKVPGIGPATYEKIKDLVTVADY
jgi:competence protein ComEA